MRSTIHDSGVGVRRPLRTATLAAAALGLILSLAEPAMATAEPAPAEAAPGAPGLGDEVFPGLGNGGYEVGHYDLDFTYVPSSKGVKATATITAKATQDLSRFNLDSAGLNLKTVQVGGTDVAKYTQEGEELVITPAEPLADGQAFEVTITYTANPRMDLPNSGWVPTENGFALAPQPAGAHTVFPSNDHPSDKATYTFGVTAPEGSIGVANGLAEEAQKNEDGTTTYRYASEHPIATELVQIAVGDYEVVDRGDSGGVRLRDVVPNNRREKLEPALKLTGKQLDWIRDRLGRFPHEAYGLLPVDTSDPDAFAFTGLETQTLTLYKPDYLEQPEDQIGSHMMHEITHTYWGNSVTPKDWSSLWLNEGHANYYGLHYRYEMGWPDSQGATTFEEAMKRYYGLGDIWRKESGPVAKPNAENLFDDQRYSGGTLVLYALEQKVGTEAFDKIEQHVLSEYAEGNLDTEDFIDAAVEVSGDDAVRPFLEDWLYGTTTPEMPGHPDWEVTPPSEAKSSAKPGPGADITGEL